MKKVIILLIVLLTLVGCRASYNISRDADEFKVHRRIVFTDTYMLEIEQLEFSDVNRYQLIFIPIELNMEDK